MCKYCEFEQENIRYDDMCEVYLLDNYMYVTTLQPTEICTEIKISYCPMCGKELQLTCSKERKETK